LAQEFLSIGIAIAVEALGNKLDPLRDANAFLVSLIFIFLRYQRLDAA
jgi:hypothetical protein